MYQDRRSIVSNPPLSAEDFDRDDMGALGDTESCTRDRTAGRGYERLPTVRPSMRRTRNEFHDRRHRYPAASL